MDGREGECWFGFRGFTNTEILRRWLRMTLLSDCGGLFVWDFGDGGEVSELAVCGDVFDGLGGGLELVEACEVGAGDLQSVEEDGGAFVVEVSGGESAEDVVEGDRDGGAVVDGLQAEDAGAAGERRVLTAGAVMVVAEVLGAQGG